VNPIWLLRLTRWARRAPSRRMQIIVGFVLVAACVLWGVEQFIGWPDALTPERIPRSIVR
jgi:hypothetical protein